METTTTTPRAWVGCLGCYNEGRLNGAWVEGEEAGDISRAVTLNGEKCATCGADEFWVFDHEGYEGTLKGECSPMEAQEKAELLTSVEDSEREMWRAWLSNGCEADPDAMRDAYFGEFSSDVEFAEYLVQESGLLEGASDTLSRYFDFEAYARDLMFDFWESDGHYFRNM
jgi:antirestriction protein